MPKPERVTNRGIWKAPWVGPMGEIVLLAIDSGGHLVVDPFTIELGTDHLEAVEQSTGRKGSHQP